MQIIRMPKGKCQCEKSCKAPAVEGSAFCKKHMHGCSRTSPVSGYEHEYNPIAYNGNETIQTNHNCYAYAMGIKEDVAELCKGKGDKCSVRFHQPGYDDYLPFSKVNTLMCPDLYLRIKKDVPGAYKTTFEQKCRPGTSKIALVIDDKHDYHFYRQDRGGMWSHKPGGSKVTNKDAKGALIYDPAEADRDYSNNNKDGLNYKYFCTYMCVPRGQKGRNTFRMKRGGKRTMKRKRRAAAATKKRIY
jgi:hypothetical protein